MPKSKILFVVAIFSVLTTAVFGSTENSAQVRKEYGGKENTPDHVMFAFLLRAMALRYEADKEFAIMIVQEYMKLGSREAEQFLQRMLAAGEDLAKTRRIVETATLCQDNLVRSKSNIYKSMDTLDDARVTISYYAYDDFRKTLKEDEKQNFEAWMDDAKEGYSYTASDHSSLYENRGIDVRIHLQQVCIRYAQEELARTQQ